MVKHTDLVPGKEYKLGSMLIGKFKRRNENGELIFINSQHGETGENAIDPDDEDDYEPLRNRSGFSKSKKNDKIGGKKGGKKRNKKTKKTRK